ncbi:MAG: putative metal-binding motif-containing protein [Labilithrix sp.]|nr:putative metal-binding motif-containing protein [Labilithrix sp.]
MLRGKRGPAALAVSTVALLMVAVSHAGCGADSPPELFVRPADGGDAADVGAEADPEVDPTLGGPCNEDAQCDDGIPCTFDRCDMTLLRCRNTPDDTKCSDDRYCNGQEKCVLRIGCAQGPVVTCQDDNPCTSDRCVEATRSCERKPRDLDGDGDPDDHCFPNRDCDDLDPNVSSTHSEVCANGKDDDCDGLVDEQPCATPANDVCATAFPVSAPGTYVITTLAARKDYATTCSVRTPSAAKDVVVAVTVPGAPADGAKDVELWATAQVAGANELAIALQTTCGQAASEIACAAIEGSAAARAIARGVTPGTIVYAIVTTLTESPVDLKVDVRAATPKPANEGCGAPEPVLVDVPFTVSLIDPAKDLASTCDRAKTGELTYAFTLDAPRDVKIFASTLSGSGLPVVTLREPGSCNDEMRCRVGQTPPLFARSLPAGTHVFSVAGTRQIDANILVKTYPPTPTPPNQSCATAPTPPATTFLVDLSTQEDALNDCLPGGLAAAYDLDLTTASDVLLIGRFPLNENGAVSLSGPLCTAGDTLRCSMGASPQRASRRNVPAGSHRAIIADELGQNGQLSVLVRPHLPPTNVTGSDGCVSPVVIPATGGFFTGDTTSMTADFNAGCDAPGQPIGGARDQMLRLDLAQQRRVVFDMSGSFYTTLLDIRTGPTCPGIEVPDACHVGFGPNKSFLDVTLPAGTYWVQIDGFSGDRGAWNLDVRVLPP